MNRKRRKESNQNELQQKNENENNEERMEIDDNNRDVSDALSMDYETLRQQQIQRNQQLLSQLTGIRASTSLSAADAASRAALADAAQNARRAAAAMKRQARAEMMAVMPRRDMPPRRAKAGVDYKENSMPTSSAAAASSSSSSSRSAPAEEDESDDIDDAPRPNADLNDFVVPDHSPIQYVSSKSSKGVPTVPLSELLPYLGEWIPLTYHSPKAAAMSFLTAGWPSPENKASHRAPPVFNKFSGIQKLLNHIALFINVDTDGVDWRDGYSNQWLDGGRRVVWFAQPTQRVDTPVIGQIIAATRAKLEEIDQRKDGEEYAAAVLKDQKATIVKREKNAKNEEPTLTNDDATQKTKSKRLHTSIKEEPVEADSSNARAVPSSFSSSSSSSSSSSPTSSDPFSVVLFVRFSGGAYIYAGPLAYFSHDTTRFPMKFTFTLTQYDQLVKTEAFNELVPSAKATGKSNGVKMP